MVDRLFPSDRPGEYYGFHALAGRAPSSLGPLFFGLVALAGSQRAAMTALAVFLAARGWLLLTVRLDPGFPAADRERSLPQSAS
ncbi:hypothetical protein [Accumulibacter sp.]|uniref:hypothetical protein n=1 Tax=Accumulibacter sp. TaxID=2053492 RepID=UPI0035B3DA72